MTTGSTDLAREYAAQIIETQRRLGSGDLAPDAAEKAQRAVEAAFASLAPEDALSQTA
jgi:hypothetical protein